MAQELQKSAGQFIDQFESSKNQQSLGKYFEKDTTEQKIFTQVVIRAVQENPDLLMADRSSLFLACQAAAQDRLLPDRKDGALVIYNTKMGDRWVKKVQWQPMIGGLRKKLANHGFSLRAEVVYENDEFAYEMGDEPRIVHKPKVFGDRGKIVGAYAIARNMETDDLYRETMTLEDLEKVRSMSKNAEGDVWTKWTTEMYRKAVAKRLFKQLPLISTELADIIERDNEQFDTAGSARVSSAARDLQSSIREEQTPQARAPIEGEVVNKEDEPAPKNKKAKKKAAKKPAPPPPEAEDPDQGEEEDGDDDEGDPLEDEF